MKITIEGKDQLPIATFGTLPGDKRYLRLTREHTLLLFDKLAVYYPEFEANLAGLYSLASVGTEGMAKFTSLGTPAHLLRAGGKSCHWNPVQGMTTAESVEIQLCPIEHQGQQCPDALMASCLENLLGVGNDRNNFFATEPGRMLFDKMMQAIFRGLGNSFYELGWFGKHPLIQEADNLQSYTPDATVWSRYKEQQSACAGWMTLVDYQKHVEARANFMVPIYSSDVDGKNYIGDMFALIKRVKKSMPGNFNVALRNMRRNKLFPIAQVSYGMFEQLKSQIVGLHGCLPETYKYQVSGLQVDENGNFMLENAIKWDGIVIMPNDTWELFDDYTGFITHRFLLTMPGVFGLAYDVKQLRQADGMGLRLYQDLMPPANGMIFMDLYLRAGFGLLDLDQMVNASYVIPPAA